VRIGWTGEEEMCRVFFWVVAGWAAAAWDLADFIQVGIEGNVGDSELRDGAGRFPADILVTDGLEEFVRWR